MSIFRVRPLGYDSNGDPIEGAPTRERLDGAAVAPRIRGEGDITDRGRAGVVEGLTLFAPYGIDLVHTDHVEIDGVLFEVIGQPGQWHNPLTGTDAGAEVNLRRAAG